MIIFSPDSHFLARKELHTALRTNTTKVKMQNSDSRSERRSDADKY